MPNDFLVKRFSFNNMVWGFIIGFLLFIYPAGGFYILAVIILSVLLYKKLNNGERPYVLNIFYVALFLRLVFIIVTHILSTYYGLGPKSDSFPGMEGGAIIGDDMGIHARAWALANTVKGIQLSEIQTKTLLNFSQYGWSFHVYFLGFIYYLFGTVPILGKCINALFGVLTGITSYFIAKELFGQKTAKLAYILVMFYPTLFLWSTTNLKDTMLISFLTFAVFCFVRFQGSRRIKYLVLFLFLLFLLSLYRFGIFYFVISAAFFSLFFLVRWDFKKVIIAMLIGFFLSIYAFVPHNLFVKYAGKFKVESLIQQQRASRDSGGSIYKIYPERFYLEKKSDERPIGALEFMQSLAAGIASIFFRPFPWEIDKTSKLIFYPAWLIYALLFLFFIFGIAVSFRYHFRRIIFPILLFFTIIFILSLTEANIGTMVRHRDMVTPIYIIFSSFGIVSLLSRNKT